MAVAYIYVPGAANGLATRLASAGVPPLTILGERGEITLRYAAALRSDEKENLDNAMADSGYAFDGIIDPAPLFPPPTARQMFPLRVTGALAITLNADQALSGIPGKLHTFRAMRRQAGSAGVTTARLTLNGAPVLGSALSWVPGDGADSVKVAPINQPIAPGDRLGLEVTAVELGAGGLLTVTG